MQNVELVLKEDRRGHDDLVSYQLLDSYQHGVLVKRTVFPRMSFENRRTSNRFIPWTNILYIEYPDEQDEHAKTESNQTPA